MPFLAESGGSEPGTRDAMPTSYKVCVTATSFYGVSLLIPLGGFLNRTVELY